MSTVLKRALINRGCSYGDVCDRLEKYKYRSQVESLVNNADGNGMRVKSVLEILEMLGYEIVVRSKIEEEEYVITNESECD